MKEIIFENESNFSKGDIIRINNKSMKKIVLSLMVCFVCLLLMGLALIFFEKDTFSSVLSIICFVLDAVILLLNVYIMILWKKINKTAVEQKYMYKFFEDDIEIVVSTPISNANATIKYSDIKNVLKTEYVTYMYIAFNAAYLINFDGNYEKFKSIMINNKIKIKEK